MKLTSTKQRVSVWTGINWHKIRYNGGSYEHRNEALGSIKDRKCLD
jgi:hypothetical protein